MVNEINNISISHTARQHNMDLDQMNANDPFGRLSRYQAQMWQDMLSLEYHNLTPISVVKLN
jgi:hypothetical protein